LRFTARQLRFLRYHPPVVALLDSRTTRVLLTILAFAAVLGFAWKARATLVVFLFAILFAYLIDPVVEWVSKRLKGSRGQAILVVYVALLIVLGIIGFFVGPRIVSQAQHLAQTVPDLYKKVSSGQIAWQIGSQHGWSRETQERLQSFLASHQQTISEKAKDYGARIGAIASGAWVLLLVPILAVFFLKDGSAFKESILQLVDRRRQRQFVEGLVEDVHVMLAHFIRAQLILAALTLVMFTIVLSIMRVPYGVVLGVLAGFLEFVPVVGPLMAALLIIGVALGSGYEHVIIVVLFLGAWRLIQDYYTSPRIMGSQVELHPLAALFGILAGAEVAGVVGVYLSIPVMATIRILWRRYRDYNRVIETPTVQDAPPIHGYR
jgi:predicted PurR-regulated permease PerM